MSRYNNELRRSAFFDCKKCILNKTHPTTTANSAPSPTPHGSKSSHNLCYSIFSFIVLVPVHWRRHRRRRRWWWLVSCHKFAFSVSRLTTQKKRERDIKIDWKEKGLKRTKGLKKGLKNKEGDEVERGKRRKKVVVALLVEWLLPTPEIRSLNPVIGKLYLLPTVLNLCWKDKNREKEALYGLFLKTKKWCGKWRGLV